MAQHLDGMHEYAPLFLPWEQWASSTSTRNHCACMVPVSPWQVQPGPPRAPQRCSMHGSIMPPTIQVQTAGAKTSLLEETGGREEQPALR